MHLRTPHLALRRSGPHVAPLLVSILIATSAAAAPTLGFREEWPGTSLQGWGGGAAVSNPGTGGVLGAGDGFLTVARAAPGKLGTFNAGVAYAGDWVAAGITQVRVWLDDVNTPDPLEIHFAIGNGSNFWQFNEGFVPPAGSWSEFVVDLSSSANWTQTIGVPTNTFTEALQNADRIHFRHDKAPYVQAPDDIQGDFGMDHLLLTNGIVGVPPTGGGAGRPVALAPPYPNPARGPVSLALEVSEPGPVRIQIVDVSGRIVREAELAAGAPGHRTWMWDGLDARGRGVPPGSYRVRAFGSSGGTSRTLVRVR